MGAQFRVNRNVTVIPQKITIISQFTGVHKDISLTINPLTYIILPQMSYTKRIYHPYIWKIIHQTIYSLQPKLPICFAFWRSTTVRASAHAFQALTPRGPSGSEKCSVSGSQSYEGFQSYCYSQHSQAWYKICFTFIQHGSVSSNLLSQWILKTVF